MTRLALQQRWHALLDDIASGRINITADCLWLPECVDTDSPEGTESVIVDN